MRRILIVAVAATFVMALTASPAASQAELGLTIDPTEGFPGTEIFGQVDQVDIATGCVTDIEEWLDIFGTNFGIYRDAYLAEFGPPPGNTYEAIATDVLLTQLPNQVVSDPEGEAAQLAFGSSFAFVFADLATVSPIVIDSFNPVTGEAGPLVTPDVAPGFYAVAAACVNIGTPPTDAGIQALRTAILALVDAFTDVGGCPAAVETPPQPPLDILCATLFLLSEEGEATVAGIAEEALPVLFDAENPNALGFQLYCVLDAEGACPGEEPPFPIDDLIDPADGVPAEAVRGAPRFTG